MSILVVHVPALSSDFVMSLERPAQDELCRSTQPTIKARQVILKQVHLRLLFYDGKNTGIFCESSAMCFRAAAQILYIRVCVGRDSR